MCAFNAALDFGRDLLKLSASTLERLVAIQLTDLTTFLERQSTVVYRIAEVRDVGGLLALQREYRAAFWQDRRSALTASADAVQTAARLAANSWTGWMSDRGAAAVLAEKKPAVKRVKRKPIAEPAVAPVPSAAERTKARAVPAKLVAVPADTGPGAVQTAARSAAKKRGAKTKKGPGGTRSPPAPR